jgi:Flp pilus assembly protein TadG
MTSNSLGRRRRQRGSYYVEVALVFLPMFAIMLAIVDFSMAIFIRATMQNAAREGVRYAVTYQLMSGMCHDASIKQTMKNSAVGFLSDPIHEDKIKIRYYNPTTLAEVTGTNSNAPGNLVEVGVEGYQWSWIAPLWRNNSPFVVNVYAADRMEGLSAGAAIPCR